MDVQQVSHVAQWPRPMLTSLTEWPWRHVTSPIGVGLQDAGNRRILVVRRAYGATHACRLSSHLGNPDSFVEEKQSVVKIYCPTVMLEKVVAKDAIGLETGRGV